MEERIEDVIADMPKRIKDGWETELFRRRLTAALERRNAEIEKVADEIWSDRHNIGVIAARWAAALRRIVREE